MRFKVQLDDIEAEIEVIHQGDQITVIRDGQTIDARVIHTDGPHFVLEVEEVNQDGFVNRKRIRAAGYREGDKRQLWANGRMISYERVPEGKESEPDLDLNSLTASIPAVVAEILVGVGEKVKSGDKLILLESMKMIIPIQAPNDGTIQEILCSEGEAVQPGVRLIEIEPD